MWYQLQIHTYVCVVAFFFKYTNFHSQHYLALITVETELGTSPLLAKSEQILVANSHWNRRHSEWCAEGHTNENSCTLLEEGEKKVTLTSYFAASQIITKNLYFIIFCHCSYQVCQNLWKSILISNCEAGNFVWVLLVDVLKDSSLNTEILKPSPAAESTARTHPCTEHHRAGDITKGFVVPQKRREESCSTMTYRT